MTPMQVLFILVAGVTLISAGFVVTTRRIMHAALWLVLTLFGVAVLFAMLESGFFAVVQVVVYIGAIAILIIFAVMLTRRVMQDTGPQISSRAWIPALAGLVLFAGLVYVLSTWSGFSTQASPLPAEAHQVGALGLAFVNPDAYLIPFEVASVLLLGALIGSIYVASERKEK